MMPVMWVSPDEAWDEVHHQIKMYILIKQNHIFM